MLLAVPHAGKDDDDAKPVQVVREDRAIGGRVLPAEDGVEDPPAATAVQLRVAAVDVPDALVDVVGAWAGAYLARIAADGLTPRVVFKVPDGLGEEAWKGVSYRWGAYCFGTNLPAPTKYKKQVEMMRNICNLAELPPLRAVSIDSRQRLIGVSSAYR